MPASRQSISGGAGGGAAKSAKYAGGYGGNSGDAGATGTPTTGNTAAAGGPGGTAAGPNGGDGANTTTGGAGGGGGGYSKQVNASGAYTVAGTVTGGTGGAGGGGGYAGGGGGAGGYGLLVGLNVTSLDNSVTIAGGTGGAGGPAGASGSASGRYNGNGGLGGYAISGVNKGGRAAFYVTNEKSGQIIGGRGGDAGGGMTSGSAGYGSDGGSGGTAINAFATGVRNLGSIRGGDGGTGNANATLAHNNGGGDGIDVATATNDGGTITGGSGGKYGENLGGAGASISTKVANIHGGTIAGGTGGYGGSYNTGGAGVVLAPAATFQQPMLSNDATSTITGGMAGQSVASSPFTKVSGGAGVSGTNAAITNFGKITGGAGASSNGQPSSYSSSGGAGVSETGGTLTNYGTVAGGAGGAGSAAKYGSTSSGAGVRAGNYFTLVNAGTINGGMSASGVQADAVDFTQGSNTIALGANASFGGNIGVGYGATLTFNQTAGSGLPANVALGATITGSGAIVKAASGALTLSGASTFGGGVTIDDGTLDLAVADATASSGAVSGAIGSGDITFAGGSGSPARLALDQAAQPMTNGMLGGTFGHNLINFDNDDSLDLKNLMYSGASAATPLTVSNNLLTVNEGSTSETFMLEGNEATTYYAHNDGAGGTVINDSQTAVCFAGGTSILTVRGEIAVEHLRVGDRVVTASGAHRPIRWLGHRLIDCQSHPCPHGVHPIRIAAHAFGPNLPERDLLLSPGHPVLVGASEDGDGGWLVPVMCLINGTTVERVAVDAVTYWHVELDTHDILLAEGLPAESYLDWGDRPFFAEGSEHALHNPDFVVPGLGRRCRPVALDGPVVEAARRRLDQAFAARLAGACAWPGDQADSSDARRLHDIDYATE